MLSYDLKSYLNVYIGISGIFHFICETMGDHE